MSQSSNPSSQWSVPTAFDGYRVLMTLSDGPRSQVCLGHDTVLDRPVVIRFLNLPEGDSLARQTFFAEARATARIAHPNVMTIYRVGESNGRPYVISEYVQGQILSTVTKPMNPRATRDCALGIARGLTAAHRRGILHRDLKPSNVVLSDEGDIKLLDFGMADLLDSGTFAVAQSATSQPPVLPGAASGSGELPALSPASSNSEAYRAPEAKQGPATMRSDVFSVGVLLYELCTGTLPTAGSGRSARPLSDRVPDLDPRFAAIVDRCLAQDPSERYGSGEEVLEALELLAPWSAADTLPEGNPYRGLLPFEAEHRGLFFGRRGEIGTLLDRLRTEAAVLVAAESGVGKSSLCRAGILPLVADGAIGSGRKWRVATMVPGRTPLRSLVATLRTTIGFEEAPLESLLRNEPAALARELAQRLGHNQALILMIDQLEELVTIAAPDEARRVGEALGSLLNRTPSIRMLMTARSDFLGRIAMLDGVGSAVTSCLYILRPLGPDRIRDVIVGPAHAKGVVFESPEVVDSLVESTAQTDGGLPLLQFALTELWEAREGNEITAAALETIGGVSGALARHADLVIAALSPDQRVLARRILMALVTLEGTRARRTEEELGGRRNKAQEVLEALVKGRLLVARDTAEGTAYEVAHEALIKGWATLRQWLEEHAESRAVRQRLETAAAEWRRLNRSREALWGTRQLAELELLDSADIGPKEREFVTASKRQALRRQRLQTALFIAVPVILGIGYGTARYVVRRDLQVRVAKDIDRGQHELLVARQQTSEVQTLRRRALDAFDAGNSSEAEALWTQMHSVDVQADRALGRASQLFEGALAADYSNARARELLADTLLERALGAERERHLQQVEDLLQRLSVYDVGGVRRARWDAPGKLSLKVQPPDAHILLGRYESDAHQKRQLTAPRDLPKSALPEVTLPVGSYLLVVSAPGHAEVRLPFVLERGEGLQADLTLPQAASIPPGYVYVPAGRFQFGAADESMRRAFLSTVPLHTVNTPAYLIARNETTYGDWIEYLNTLPPDQRGALLSRPAKGNMSGSVQLSVLPNGTYQLTLNPISLEATAVAGQPFGYRARKLRDKGNWLQFPVGGVTYDDAQSYARWLDSSGRVPGARLCDEFEWERAARGADDREFPHGDSLDGTEANFDATYDKENAALGPDEVGSYPASRSPFGIDDMAGNAFEWVLSRLKKDEAAARSGSYAQAEVVLRATNRNAFDHTFHDPSIGLRICASWPPKK